MAIVASADDEVKLRRRQSPAGALGAVDSWPASRRAQTPPKAGPGTAGVPARTLQPPRMPPRGAQRPRLTRQRRALRQRAGGDARAPRKCAAPCIRRCGLRAGVAPQARTTWVRGRLARTLQSPRMPAGRAQTPRLSRRHRASRQHAGGDARGPGPRLRRGKHFALPRRRRGAWKRAGRMPAVPGPAFGGASISVQALSIAAISPVRGGRGFGGRGAFARGGSGGRLRGIAGLRRARGGRAFPADIAPCGNVRAGCPRSRAPPSAG